VGGVEIYINLDSCAIYDYSTPHSNEMVIDVPKVVTNGRSIITALGLFMWIRGSVIPTTGSELHGALASQMNGVVGAAAISTARLELVGENKVLVINPNAALYGGRLKCVVENNKNLSNISPRSYQAFAELAVLGIKAYIHNHLVVKLGKGYIYNGHELGIVTDLISEYSSSNEEYRTYLKDVWTKVAFHNDKDRLGNHIATML